VGPLRGRDAPGVPSLLVSSGTSRWEQSQPSAACRCCFSIANTSCLALGKPLTKCPPKQQNGGRRHSFTFSCSQSWVTKLQRGFPGRRERDSRMAMVTAPTANETRRQPLAGGGHGRDQGWPAAPVRPPHRIHLPAWLSKRLWQRGRLSRPPWGWGHQQSPGIPCPPTCSPGLSKHLHCLRGAAGLEYCDRSHRAKAFASQGRPGRSLVFITAVPIFIMSVY